MPSPPDSRGSQDDHDIEVVAVDSVDPGEIATAVRSAFDASWSDDWYRWKHLDGPWGPSVGFVARDRSGIVGVRLALPWELTRDGVDRLGHRAVEAATVPRAQGRGIFGILTDATMDLLSDTAASPILLSTPNDRSRSTHRRLGWTQVGSIQHRSMAVRPALTRSALTDVDLDAVPAAAGPAGAIATRWTPAALRWRLSPASGHEYRAVRFRDSVSGGGLVYRRAMSKGLRSVVLVHAWGEPAERRALLRAVAREERSVMALGVVGAGADDVVDAPGPATGSSTVTAWQPVSAQDRWPMESLARWSLGLIDLEGVI